MADTFVCELCGRTFRVLETWTEADKLMEYQDTFTEEQRATEDMPLLVCEGCWEMEVSILDFLKRYGLI